MKRSQENPSADKTAKVTSAASTTDYAVSGDSVEANSESSFLGRWSRRKRGVEVAESQVSDTDLLPPLDTDDGSPQTVSPKQQPEQKPEQEKSVKESSLNKRLEADSAEPAPLTDADMPDIETLNADSDFSPFFSDGVSKELRNLALKKLFFSGKFSIRDGLDDYDDDFTKFEPLGDTVTSDMKFHARRKEKARLAELEEQRLLDEAAAQENTETEAIEDDSNNELADQELDVEDKPEQVLSDSKDSGADEDDPAIATATTNTDKNNDVALVETPEDAGDTPTSDKT